MTFSSHDDGDVDDCHDDADDDDCHDDDDNDDDDVCVTDCPLRSASCPPLSTPCVRSFLKVASSS